MISEYNIIVTNSVTSLIEKVNEEIQKGWQPHGNFQLDPQNGKCSQAVVKFDGEDDEFTSFYDKVFKSANL